MRALLTTIAGDPARVSVSAAAIVALGAVIGGHGLDLLAALWTLIVAATTFCTAFMALAIAGSLAGVIQPPPMKEESDDAPPA
ncbi:hypothetical protein [uncultured Methylobacterium sp.]|uniref:hypothetical protein n=1 Tax=uncultured Methylobacterium sp. TaxID=157278 RepID=UPI0035CC8BD5